MMEHNLRHLRVLLAVVAHASVTRAAEACHVSQPAVTQALSELEQIARGLMVQLESEPPDTSRPIGITTRVGWEPTPSQADFLALLQRQGRLP